MTETLTPAAPAAATPAGAMARKRFSMPTYSTLFGCIWLIGLALMALFADYLPFIRSYKSTVKVHGKSGAGYKFGPGYGAWFGTDSAGRDVFAKCIYGARITLLVGIGATVIGLTIGGLLGVAAGYFRGWTDRVVSIFTDSLLALPPLVLASVLIFRFDDLKKSYTWLGWASRTWQITLVLSILSIAPLARIVRAQTLSLTQREFVLAARSLGAKNWRIIYREIFPNLIPAMLSVAFTGLGILIAAEGALAFLGFSVETPTPTWGKMIQLAYKKLDKAWWATIFPCGMLFMTVLAFNLLGDRLARKFDIREATL